jgi:hypothetical protein
MYEVGSQLLHWESHIVLRPGEALSADVTLKRIRDDFQRALKDVPSLTMAYYGFFVTDEGTLCAKGYGPLDLVREPLCNGLPYSSKRQSAMGHVSFARILDPIGPAAYNSLLALRDRSRERFLGEVVLDNIKLVKERRWYMEDHEILTTAFLT